MPYVMYDLDVCVSCMVQLSVRVIKNTHHLLLIQLELYSLFILLYITTHF
jgi:hypothetical protein